MIYQLHALRDTAAWQEVHNSGVEQGTTQAKEKMIRNCLAKGMPVKEIAALVEMPLKDVRRLAKQLAK